MQSFITTSCVGGRDGYIFQDVYIGSDDGGIVINDLKKDQLKLDFPIKSIAVSHGGIVDGLAITYNLATGGKATLDHGSQLSDENLTTVNLSATEILINVFGRAGYQSKYDREMVNNIGFVIFDTAKATTRTVGPFGNHVGTNEGKPFTCSDVIAFGGFALNDESHLGLSGLFFYKDVGKR